MQCTCTCNVQAVHMRCVCGAHAEQDFTGDASESDLCKAFAKARELEIFVYDELLKMHKVPYSTPYCYWAWATA
jgi:hypothetical protein